MTAVTASLVKELRERTGAGMMECKKALVAAQGDINQAIEDMRKAGQAKAVKRSSKTTAEGIIVIKSVAQKAVMLEVNSETDFVAREQEFGTFGNQVAEKALEANSTTIDDIANLNFTETDQTVETARKALVAKLGENISLRRCILLSTTQGVVGAYLHGARIGSLVEIEGNDAELARDLAMHVAAMNPEYLSMAEVPEPRLAKERAIFAAQEVDSKKPDDIKDKIIAGKLNKFIQTITLLGQSFVKDPNTTVEKLLSSKKTSIKRYVRFEVGEGITKEADNFVAEVMSQVKGA